MMNWKTVFLLFFCAHLLSGIHNSFAGTVDSATLTPAELIIPHGTGPRDIVFSALNDKPFDLKSYKITMKISDVYLGVAIASVSPSPVKAVVNTKKNTIILEWEAIPQGVEMQATLSVERSIEGTSTITPGESLFKDYNHNRYRGTCNLATIIDRIEPPTISNINVNSITDDSATISWTTDQPSSTLFEYGTTTAYGNTHTDSALTTSYNITLTGLSYATTYHFRITTTNGYGLSSSSSDQTFTTQSPTSPITINITSPFDGETIFKAEIMVKGTVTNTTGNETGIKVNGVLATLYGNEFAANHIPLTEGSSAITVTATDTAGNSATTSITVNAVTTGNYIKITSNIESGIAPLEATLSISGYASGTTPSLSYLGPASVDLTNCTSYDACKAMMTIEGIYYFTASGTATDGNTYQDTIAITALSMAEMDVLLKNKWDGMKGALTNGDMAAALSYILSGSQASYQTMFSVLSDQLSSIIATERGFNLIDVTDNVARYKLLTLENGKTYSYEVIFIKDTDGLWRIKEF